MGDRKTEYEAGRIVSAITKSGKERSLFRYAFAEALNQVRCQGALPKELTATILLGTETEESELKEMAALIRTLSETYQVPVADVRVKTLPHLAETIVTAEVAGEVEVFRGKTEKETGREQDIVLVKSIGTEGMLRLLEKREEELSKRFVPAFLRGMKESRRELFSLCEIESLVKLGAEHLYQVGEGGIFDGLWNFAELVGMGIHVDMRSLTVKQETIEVCEYFKLNPYELASAGTLLATADNGEKLAELLFEQGICAAVIGRTTKKKERVLRNKEELRYLDRPASDEIYKI